MSPEDDVYALGLTLLEMWTCRVPEPGYKPRNKPMRSQIMFDVPAGLSIDEIKQVFRCLSEDAQQRLTKAKLDLEAVAVKREYLQRFKREVGAQQEDGSALWVMHDHKDAGSRQKPGRILLSNQ